MAKTRRPTSSEAPLVIGGTRHEPAAWLGLGILGLVVVVMSGALWGFAGQGPWPVPIVWAVALPIAARLLTTRELHVTEAGVRLTRHLFRLRWGRFLPRGRFTRVRVGCAYVPPRHMHGDGSPEAEAPLLMFTTVLRGRPDITLGFGRDAVALEALARRAAAVLGLPLEREGYVRRPKDGLPLRRRGVESMLP